MKAWPCLGRFGEQGLYLSVGGAVGLGFAEAAGGGGSQVRGSSQQQVPGGRVAGSLGTGSLRPQEPWGSCNSRKRGQGCVREAASPQHCNQDTKLPSAAVLFRQLQPCVSLTQQHKHCPWPQLAARLHSATDTPGEEFAASLKTAENGSSKALSRSSFLPTQQGDTFN